MKHVVKDIAIVECCFNCVHRSVLHHELDSFICGNPGLPETESLIVMPDHKCGAYVYVGRSWFAKKRE